MRKGANNKSYAAPLLLVKAEYAAQLCSMDPTTWRRLSKTGRVPAGLKLAGCRRWSLYELQQWVAAGCPPDEVWRGVKAG